MLSIPALASTLTITDDTTNAIVYPVLVAGGVPEREKQVDAPDAAARHKREVDTVLVLLEAWL
jgi:hypothetical protein